MTQRPEQILAAMLADTRVRLALDPDSYVNAANALRAVAVELEELRKYRSKAETEIITKEAEGAQTETST